MPLKDGLFAIGLSRCWTACFVINNAVAILLEINAVDTAVKRIVGQMRAELGNDALDIDFKKGWAEATFHQFFPITFYECLHPFPNELTFGLPNERINVDA